MSIEVIDSNMLKPWQQAWSEGLGHAQSGYDINTGHRSPGTNIPLADFSVRDGQIHWGPKQQMQPYAQQITGDVGGDHLMICSMDNTTAYIAQSRELNFHLDCDDAVFDRLMTAVLSVVQYVVDTAFDPITLGLTYEQVMRELAPDTFLIAAGNHVSRDIMDVLQSMMSVDGYNIRTTYVVGENPVMMGYATFVQGLAYEYMRDLCSKGLLRNDPVGANLVIHYQVHTLNVQLGRVYLVVYSG